MGFSDEHYALVANVHHMNTGHISPKFNLVFNDLSEMVICTREDESVFNSICNNIFELNMNWYSEDEHDGSGKFIY